MSIRVLMLGPDPHGQGGIATIARDMLDGPLSRSVEIDYLVTHEDSSRARRVLRGGRAGTDLVRTIVRRRPDLIHAHVSSHGSFLRKATFVRVARLASVPVLLHVNGSRFDRFLLEAPGWLRSWGRATLEGVDRVVAVSPQWRDSLSEIAPGARIAVVPNGVPVPSQPVRDHPNGPFVFLGRLGERKGSSDLVRALARTKNSKPHVVLAGDGPREEHLALADDLGVANRIEAPGWVDAGAARQLLGSACGFVLPTYAEGLPLALLEAMAHGLACISTPVGGIPEVLSDGVTGLLIQPGDKDALAGALDRLADDPGLRRQLGMRARALVERRFSDRAVSAAMVDVYRDVLDERARQGLS